MFDEFHNWLKMLCCAYVNLSVVCELSRHYYCRQIQLMYVCVRVSSTHKLTVSVFVDLV